MGLPVMQWPHRLCYDVELDTMVIFKDGPFWMVYSDYGIGWIDEISTRKKFGGHTLVTLDEWYE